MEKPRRSLQYSLMLLTAVLLYVLLFILFPSLCPHFYPQSNEATAFLLILLFLFSSAGVLLFDLKLWHWISADLLLGLLLLCYDGSGLYGIGLRGVLLDGAKPRYDKPLAALTVAGLLLLMLLLQGLCLLLKKWLLRKKA